MIAYKANTAKWTQEEGFQTTGNVIIGKLWRNPDGPWTIAYQIEEDGSGYAGVKNYMVDKNTVEEVNVKKITDYMKKVYWFEELEE